MEQEKAAAAGSGEEYSESAGTTGRQPAPKRLTALDESGRWAFDWLQSLCAAVVAAVLLLTFLTPVIGVVGPSMRSTLQDGDRLLTLRGWICGDYKRGDVVIVRKASFDREPIVKRVIAVAGETVDIDFENGIVTVDGTPLQEDYIKELTFLEEGTAFPLTVPEGCLFLMGDNRNNSSDSRNPAIGTVDARLVIGRAVWILFPGPDEYTNQRDFGRIGVIPG